MKFLFDFFPVALFFAAYTFFADLPVILIHTANQLPLIQFDQDNSHDAILFATLVIIIATIIQNIVYFMVHKKFEKMHLITLGVLLVFGTLTLILKDPNILKVKVTVINWIFAIVFLGSQFVGQRKTLSERMLSSALQVPPEVWKKADFMWAGFFAAIGVLNLIVAAYVSDGMWVNFKTFGVFGLTFIFIILQVLYLQKYAVESKP